MLVDSKNVEEVLASLQGKTHLALDTETTGLRPYHGDRLFSIQLSDGEQSYYFNFNPKGVEICLCRQTDLSKIKNFIEAFRGVWFIHNARYDVSILRGEGIRINSEIHDTQSVSRLVDSHRGTGSLASLAPLVGLEKDPKVKEYIKTNHLWEWEIIPGKKRKVKKEFYDRVPLDLMEGYGADDALITYRLGEYQLAKIKELDKDQAAQYPKVSGVLETDKKLTKVVSAMEEEGVLIDLEFCRKAIAYEEEREREARQTFKSITGAEYKSSGKLFDSLFRESQKDFYVTTKKGNPSFDSSVLKYFTHPAAKVILELRDSKSRQDFYHGFLYHADKDALIHTSFNQDGTVTGRFSSSNPNLQNLTKEEEVEEKEFLIRRAFIPRKDHLFLMIDYNQMEYRLMLDYVGCPDLIEEIKGGLDVHEAMAKFTGLSRRVVKNVNFACLYGAGLPKLSKMIGCSEDEARKARDKVFEAAPGMREFIQRVMAMGERRGWIFNWAGRRLRCPDRNLSYKLPNYIIQGGCADVVKQGMVKVHEFLSAYRSKLLLQIHDELVIECPYEERHLSYPLVEILENIYPCRHLPLTCSIEWSDKNLADKVKGHPIGAKTRDTVSGESQKASA